MKQSHASIALNCLTYNTRIAPVTSHVAQLVPLPKSFQERFGMCSATRAPYCMRDSDFYHLHKSGGPKFRSISASSAAALFRTSLTTVTSWPIWISQLETCAKEFLSLHQWRKGAKSPTCWDTDPLALNLKYAYNGFPDNPKWAAGRASLHTKLLAQEQFFHARKHGLSGMKTLPQKDALLVESVRFQDLSQS